MRGLRSLAADQQQVTGSVPGEEVARDEGAERAGGAGDQHGAVRVQRGMFVGRSLIDLAETRQVGGSGTQHQLRLSVRCPRAERRDDRVCRASIGVQQDEPVRLLGLRGPQQTPDRARREIVHAVVRERGEGTVGHHDQARTARPGLGQPSADEVQGAVDVLGGRGGDIARCLAADDGEHQLRNAGIQGKLLKGQRLDATTTQCLADTEPVAQIADDRGTGRRAAAFGRTRNRRPPQLEQLLRPRLPDLAGLLPRTQREREY